MPTIEFGSRQAANDTRDNIEQYLSRADDRRELVVKLKSSTPDRIVKRVRQAALRSREQRSRGAGKVELTDKEQQSLDRQHPTFSWRKHGFQAMSVKAAMQEEGVTEWMDYYEPGEGVESALGKLRSAKQQAQQTGANIGVESDRTDMEEVNNMGRRATQARKAQSEQTRQAVEPAIVGSDPDAVEFLREEQRFGGDPFDIVVSGSGPSLEASGEDLNYVRERNDKRTAHARLMDDLRAADITNDPLKWAQNPQQYDFPGVDTLEPEKVHDRRSERARDVDNQELAPIAEDRKEWAANPDQYDWPGVDTPEGAELDMVDDRAKQDTLGFAGDPTEDRESRVAAEESSGGLLEDTRESIDRGADTNDTDAGSQGTLPGLDDDVSKGLDEFAADDDREPDDKPREEMDERDAAAIGREISKSMRELDEEVADDL